MLILSYRYLITTARKEHYKDFIVQNVLVLQVELFKV